MNTNPNAKRILIYGDSFVFGKIPGGSRYPSDKRFTGVIQNELGNDYEIVEEGLRGRTVSGENAFFPHRNGLSQFGPIFGSHLPIGLLVLFLGTNDINSGSTKTPEGLEESFNDYKKFIEWWCSHLGFPVPQVMLVAPPLVEEEQSYPTFQDLFKGAKEKSYKFSDLYKNIAVKYNWHFLNSSKIVKSSQIDGIHLDEKGNESLGKEIAKIIKSVNL